MDEKRKIQDAALDDLFNKGVSTSSVSGEFSELMEQVANGARGPAIAARTERIARRIVALERATAHLFGSGIAYGAGLVNDKPDPALAAFVLEARPYFYAIQDGGPIGSGGDAGPCFEALREVVDTVLLPNIFRALGKEVPAGAHAGVQTAEVWTPCSDPRCPIHSGHDTGD